MLHFNLSMSVYGQLSVLSPLLQSSVHILFLSLFLINQLCYFLYILIPFLDAGKPLIILWIQYCKKPMKHTTLKFSSRMEAVYR